jgi:putative transposase
MRYRRTEVTGVAYFFTANLAERKRTLLVNYMDTLREAMRMVKAKHRFNIDAMVILPDHLHALWTLPVDDCAYPHGGG